jgi:hypothetical protein
MHLHPTRFDSQDDAPARNPQYRLIEGVHGFTRSHWTTSLIEYSADRIAPDGWRGCMPKKRQKSTRTDGGVACQKKDKKVPYLSAVSLALAVRWYVTNHIDQLRGSRAITIATGRHLQASMAADISKPDIIFRFFFRVFSLSVG